jgi:hypothetical protein
MNHSLAIVLKILVYISVMAEQHSLVEESVVDREDLGHGVDERKAERAVWVKFRGRSFEHGEGSGREFAHVDAGGHAVVLGAD